MVDFTQLPVIGPWARKVGAVSQIVNMPCSTTPQMWVEGFFEAAPKMIWSLFKPDPTDVEFVRAGGRHGHRKTPHFNFGRAINAKMFARFGAVGMALFDLAELANTAGWWFMIIDAGVDLAYNWTSAVYRNAGCLPGTRYCMLETDPAEICLPGFDHTVLWAYKAGDIIMDGVQSIIIPSGMSASVGWGMACKRWDPVPVPPPNFAPKLVDDQSGKVIRSWPPITPGVGETKHAGGVHNVGRQSFLRSFSVHYDNLGGYGAIGGSTLSATDNDVVNLLADP